MLTEEDVIAVVCDHLSGEGYRIDQQCRTTQHGIDIIATHPASGGTFRIEAKGETSNRWGSRRFGTGFSRALPSTNHHLEFISRIRATLQALGIVVFWVDPHRRVRIDLA